jgi:hypothetical protein
MMSATAVRKLAERVRISAGMDAVRRSFVWRWVVHVPRARGVVRRIVRNSGMRVGSELALAVL